MLNSGVDGTGDCREITCVTAECADGRRWSAHPWAARGLRLLVFGLPLLASVAFVQALTSVTGVPTSSLWVFLGWWFGVSLLASGVVSVLYALTRRLLPLGALLGLSLVFPDEAPSRFRLALAADTVESLERRLSEMREGDAQESAEILLQLVAALDVHDHITRGHAERVRGYAASLGRELGLPKDDLDRLNWSALLHNIGKLKVDTKILNKPGRPTDEEWATLRQASARGRGARGAASRLARRVGGCDRLPPRALGRNRLSARHGRGGDPARRTHRRDRVEAFRRLPQPHPDAEAAAIALIDAAGDDAALAAAAAVIRRLPLSAFKRADLRERYAHALRRLTWPPKAA